MLWPLPFFAVLGAFGFLRNLYRPQLSGGEFPSWIDERLRQIAMQIAQRSTLRRTPLSGRPSQLSSERVSFSTIEALPHRSPGVLTRFEYRYPYLDRDLNDFLLRVPRDRLLRPGRRRALMRSALQKIVPHEVLERRRKGTRSRSVLLTLQHGEQEIRQLFRTSSQQIQELVDSHLLEEDVIAAIRRSDQVKMPFIIRAIHFHLWYGAHSSLMTEPGGWAQDSVAS